MPFAVSDADCGRVRKMLKVTMTQGTQPHASSPPHPLLDCCLALIGRKLKSKLLRYPYTRNVHDVPIFNDDVFRGSSAGWRRGSPPNCLTVSPPSHGVTMRIG